MKTCNTSSLTPLVPPARSMAKESLMYFTTTQTNLNFRCILSTYCDCITHTKSWPTEFHHRPPCIQKLLHPRSLDAMHHMLNNSFTQTLRFQPRLHFWNFFHQPAHSSPSAIVKQFCNTGLLFCALVPPLEWKQKWLQSF